MTTGKDKISFCQNCPFVLEDRKDFLPSRITISPSQVASKSMQIKYRNGLEAGLDSNIFDNFESVVFENFSVLICEYYTSCE